MTQPHTFDLPDHFPPSLSYAATPSLSATTTMSTPPRSISQSLHSLNLGSSSFTSSGCSTSNHSYATAQNFSPPSTPQVSTLRGASPCIITDDGTSQTSSSKKNATPQTGTGPKTPRASSSRKQTPRTGTDHPQAHQAQFRRHRVTTVRSVVISSVEEHPNVTGDNLTEILEHMANNPTDYDWVNEPVTLSSESSDEHDHPP